MRDSLFRWQYSSLWYRVHHCELFPHHPRTLGDLVTFVFPEGTVGRTPGVQVARALGDRLVGGDVAEGDDEDLGGHNQGSRGTLGVKDNGQVPLLREGLILVLLGQTGDRGLLAGQDLRQHLVRFFDTSGERPGGRGQGFAPALAHDDVEVADVSVALRLVPEILELVVWRVGFHRTILAHLGIKRNSTEILPLAG